MALRLELVADEVRGPGYGLLRVSGGAPSGPVDLCLQGNQANYGYLAVDGRWQAQEFWHELPPPRIEGPLVMIELGPELMDPVATLPPIVALQARLRWEGREDRGVVKLVRPLYASSAAGTMPSGARNTAVHGPVATPAAAVAIPESPAADVPPADAPPPEEPIVPPPAPVPAPPPAPARRWPLAAAVVVLLLAAGLGAAYYAGLLTLGGPGGEAASAVPVAPGSAATPQEAAPPAIASLADVKRYLETGPAADAAAATAAQLVAGGKPDLALLLHQYAARAGRTESSVAVARMYDPDTWTAQSSALPQPDAETAAYWYEAGALAGSVEAQRQLGKILVALNPAGFQRDKGREWLGKAAAAGDPAARKLLDETNGRDSRRGGAR